MKWGELEIFVTVILLGRQQVVCQSSVMIMINLMMEIVFLFLLALIVSNTVKTVSFLLCPNIFSHTQLGTL